VYETPANGLCILHAQVETKPEEETDIWAGIELPSFLKTERRLIGSADEEDYGAYSLSLIDIDTLKKSTNTKKRQG
jgi:hypothetical protein